MKLGASAFVLLALILGFDFVANSEIATTRPFEFLVWFLLILLPVSMLGWLLIVAAQALKYDVLPAFVKLVRNPEAAVRGAFAKLVRNPGATLRESWNEL